MTAFSSLSRGLLACALMVSAGAVLAANPELGRQKAEQVCASCHGKDGNTPIDPSYPKLAGQHKDFLERALLDYRSEARKNAIMVAQAKQLTRDDVRNLAAYYSALPGGLSVKR
jgi:cytochrome c553